MIISVPLKTLINRLYEVGKCQELRFWAFPPDFQMVLTVTKKLRSITRQITVPIDENMTMAQAGQAYWQIMKHFDAIQTRHYMVKELKKTAVGAQ